jgi:hypothetical protein
MYLQDFDDCAGDMPVVETMDGRALCNRMEPPLLCCRLSPCSDDEHISSSVSLPFDSTRPGVE